MLDDYIIDQPIGYRLLKNTIKKDKLSHAYLFEANGYSKSLDMAIAFAKYLICPKKYSNNVNCEKCSICERIDNNSFLEIKIINPDGLWIKKEQLELLQNEFSKRAVESNKKIYIINQAEKLNVQAANSILKFLEEPEADIIAILITNNLYQLLETITSRCQLISLNKNKELCSSDTNIKIANILFNSNTMIDKYISDTSNNEKIIKIIEFINFYEKNKINTLLHSSKMWHEYFSDKDEIIIAFDIIILYYKDVINFKLDRKIEIFDKYIDKIEDIADRNNIIDLSNKINLLLMLKNKLRLNANNNLILDKFVISLEEV